MKRLTLKITTDDFEIITEALAEYAIVCGQAAEGVNYKLNKEHHMYKVSKKLNRIKRKIQKQAGDL